MTDPELQPWFPEAISPTTGTTLAALRDAQLLDRFYLAGGTGLALQFGHRQSLDLDFFARSTSTKRRSSSASRR